MKVLITEMNQVGWEVKIQAEKAGHETCDLGSYNFEGKQKDLAERIAELKPDCIIPTDQDRNELLYWAKRMEACNMNGIKILVNNADFINLSYDKLNSYNFCKVQCFDYPKLYRNSNQIDSFPLVAKPRTRSEHNKSVILRNMKDVYHFTSGRKDILIQEFIDGDEYYYDVIPTPFDTFCCMSRFVERKKKRSQISLDSGVVKFGKEIAETFGITSFSSVHIIKKNMEFYFLDISPIPVEGFIVYCLAGMNMVDYAIRSAFSEGKYIGWGGISGEKIFRSVTSYVEERNEDGEGDSGSHNAE